MVPAPWNRGHVVVIGDAAHSCPPTIAQGAAQALEDALVLTELLVARDAMDQDLWDAFHARRIPRAQRVVEASVQLGQWQLDGVRDADVAGLMFGVAHEMAEPA
jgi:2-polyprenyl-6-methoxyphenol hydroxylase-like FAD-dependent oxidoreductase